MKNALTVGNSLFDSFFDQPRMFWSPERHLDLNLDVRPEFTEDEKSYHLSFDLPGVKKKELKLETHENRISIRASRKKKSGETWTYEKTFEVPTHIDFEKVDAKFEDGVLEITLPKARSAQKKEIEIH